LDLRDHYGFTQVLINPNQKEIFAQAEHIRSEWVLKIVGKVQKRLEGAAREENPTGGIEVITSELEVLSEAKTPPFEIDVDRDVNEELRLQYRFLDLRRPKLQDIMRKRDKMITAVREYMHGKEFTEVTTPILANSSPEGARDYLVPSRLHPGTFYALPQAPQQFKQLLMVAGLDRYFQIAPCFRDEDPRADRSPGEFYQLDLEISFAQNHEDVFTQLEPLVIKLSEEFAGKQVKWKPFPRIPYQEAIEKYGSDKPDLRFEMELTEVSDILQSTEFSVFANALKNSTGTVKALCTVGGSSLSRSQIDELTEMVKKEGAGGLAYIICDPAASENAVEVKGSNGDPMYLRSPILKFLSPTEIEGIASRMKASAGDIIFFGADDRAIVNKVLGKLRLALGDAFGLKDPNILAWAWIIDFPMYEWSDTEKKIDFMHNPFSMPQGGLEALNSQDPLQIKADQYDIVANGYELCSGAIRNYNPEVMYKAFEIVGINKETVDEKFGSMIRAFEYGAPPHGGCAFGLDRWFMLLENEPNIREVIAFPKNGSAEDVMMNAPSNVDEKQLKELHIKLDLPPKKI
jgi:aspartyl-tRNA synthetase